ncbi:MAG: hypothetical protein ING36_08710 [Burkholderiales bacterium]|jgi:hypothetical protein|nr:hypothetical protein [Burkholderiales bacterium]
MLEKNLLFTILLCISVMTTQICNASTNAPIARVEFWGTGLQVDPQIFADKNGKPQLNTVLANISGQNSVVDARTQNAVCQKKTCTKFLDLTVNHYELEQYIYIFKQTTIGGKLFAQIRYGKKWGWVRPRNEDLIVLLEKNDVLCYQEMREQKSANTSKVLQGGNVALGGSIHLSAKAKEGKSVWELAVKIPSTLSIESPDGLQTTISPIGVANKSERQTGGILEKGKPLTLLAPAGRYRITLEEPLEGDAMPSCPSITLEATVRATTPPKDQINAIETQARKPQQIPLAISSTPQVYRATLSWLHPVVTFVAPTDKPSIVKILLSEPLAAGVSFTEDRNYRPLKGKGPWLLLADHDGESSVSLKLDDPVPTDKVVNISFSAANLLLQNSATELFSLVKTPLKKIDLGDPLSLRFQVRNNGGFDLPNVEVFVKPYPDNSTPSDFNPKRPWDTELIRVGKERGEHYSGWIERIPNWKKGEVRTFDYGTVIDRTTGTGIYGVSFDLISLEKRPIKQSFAVSYFKLVEVLPREAFTTNYEKGLRVKVFGICAKRDPSYQSRFQTCQDTLLKVERGCRKIVRAGSPNFETCVRASLHDLDIGLID